MTITRADIAGALKLIHANNLVNRRGHIQNMLAKEHPEHEVAKILTDLESYAGWAENTHLDVVTPPTSAVPVRKARKR